MIRKTERYYKKIVKTWYKNKYNDVTHTQLVKRTTIWFLFMPIFWTETIEHHTI